nr:MAG TPA: hypothetical protein [Caudoviricetes sp.]
MKNCQRLCDSSDYKIYLEIPSQAICLVFLYYF